MRTWAAGPAAVSEPAAASEPTVLVIGGRLPLIEKAKELGLRVVLLQHPERLLPGQAAAADAMILLDYRDWEVTLPLVEAAHQGFGFSSVVSLVDQAMELAGEINDRLGLAGTSREVARRFRDKLAMRQWLREIGFESVAAEEITSAAQLRAFGARYGYPFVLKPVDATGSRGVERIDRPEELKDAWQRATELRGREDAVMAKFFPIDRFMAEEYIDGTEYSVETFSFDGHHVVISFTDKISDGAVEIGHAQPAIIDPLREAALERHVVGFLDAMGLRDGVGCVEVKASPAGPRIIEGHDRVAGDRVMDLVEAVYGIDLEQYAVGWPFRMVSALPTRPAARGAAATRFLSAPPGTVVAIEGVELVRDRPEVLEVDLAVEVGAEVRPLSDNFDRPGQVIVTADDTATAVARCAALAESIKVITIPTAG